MTPSTARSIPPATAGAGHAAPTPANPKSDDAGWAMVPHTLASDVRLTAADVRIVLALIYFARSKDICTSCDQSIGERAGGVSAGTVQRSLRRLEACGYIRRLAIPPSDANRTGRVIHLLWRTGGAAGAEQLPNQRRPTPRSRARGGADGGARPIEQQSPTPRSRLRDKGESGEVENRNVNVTDSIPSDAQTAPPLAAQVSPPAPCVQPPVAQTAMPQGVEVPMPPVAQPAMPRAAQSVMSAMPQVIQSPVQPAVPLLEELQAINASTSPEQVRRLASRLAQALHDPGSLGCYLSVLARVVAGTLSLPCLVAAYKAGVGAVDKAQRPGAIFMYTLRNWVQPPLPSQVRYYQTPSHPPAPPPGTVTPAGEPEPDAEDLKALRGFAADPRHPLRHVARRRLMELGIDLTQIGAGGTSSDNTMAD